MKCADSEIYRLTYLMTSRVYVPVGCPGREAVSPSGKTDLGSTARNRLSSRHRFHQIRCYSNTASARCFCCLFIPTATVLVVLRHGLVPDNQLGCGNTGSFSPCRNAPLSCSTQDLHEDRHPKHLPP